MLRRKGNILDKWAGPDLVAHMLKHFVYILQFSNFSAYNAQSWSYLILIYRMYRVGIKSPAYEISKQSDNFKLFILE